MPVAVRRPSGPRGTPGLALLLALSMVCGVLVVVTSGTAGAEPAESTSAPAPVADLVPAGPVEVTGILSSIERDVGASAPLHDGNRIWAFGDSYGGGFHTSTAAFTTAQAPHTLVEHLDANAERAPFVPQDAGEAAFNRGLRFHPLAPARLADTRDASGALWPAGRAPGPLGGGETLWLDLDAHPALAGLVGGGAAVLNLTGVNTTEGSVATHLAVGPLFVPFTTSTLNLAPGEVAANLTTVGLGLGGINGIRNHTGTTHVVVDLLGFADAAHTVPGAPS
ncbi:MAG TPA: hypothetical protein PKA98_21965, partial [Acidimicrobiales bacterium]|nr:hypothetical protein [Acidimicrobiales bacterium]